MPKGDIYKLEADPDDGTTNIPRLFLDALPLAKLSGIEMRCILHLCRETLGWQRKEKQISLSEWMEHTGANKSRVSMALTSLVQYQIFHRTELGIGKGYIYSINTKISTWNDKVIDKVKLQKFVGVQNTQTVQERQTVIENDNSSGKANGCQKRRENSSKKANRTVQKKQTPLDTKLASPKEILKKYIKKRDDRYIDFNTEEDVGGVTDFPPGEAADFWGRALQSLQGQVSKTNFHTWLEKTTGVGYRGKRFIVGVPTEFIAEHLDRNSRSMLERTLIQVTKQNFQIFFLIDGTGAAPPLEDSP